MAHPPGAETVVVYGQWRDIDGQPARGTVTIQLEQSTADQNTNTIYTTKPKVYTLDGDGSIQAELIKTGGVAGDEVPLSRPVAVVITESFEGSRPSKWRTVINTAALDAEGQFNLADAAEVTSRPQNQYVLLGSYAAGLASKANIDSPTFTGTVGGITKAMVGLSNVDNTSDVNKPVSNAQQTALNGKADNATVNSKSGALALTDANDIVLATGNITIPTNGTVAFPIGTRITVIRDAASTVTIGPPSGSSPIIYRAANSTPLTSTSPGTIAIRGVVRLTKVATDTWYIDGSIS